MRFAGRLACDFRHNSLKNVQPTVAIGARLRMATIPAFPMSCSNLRLPTCIVGSLRSPPDNGPFLQIIEGSREHGERQHGKNDARQTQALLVIRWCGLAFGFS